MLKQVHVTDVNDTTTFSVNTFERALRGIHRPLGDLPHVVHLRHGSPCHGVIVGTVTGRDGRTRIEVIEPARGPRGPYIRNVTVDREAIFPDGTPTPESRRFLSALGQYRRNPNDYYWDAANAALRAWIDAEEAHPIDRSALVRGHLPEVP